MTQPGAPAEAVRHLVVLPDLGLGTAPLVLSAWLSEPGGELVAGDRLVEIAAPNVTVDLPAPVDGILLEQLVLEGADLRPGDVIAVLQRAVPPAN